jgi:hypothetical protein
LNLGDVHDQRLAPLTDSVKRHGGKRTSHRVGNREIARSIDHQASHVIHANPSAFCERSPPRSEQSSGSRFVI